VRQRLELLAAKIALAGVRLLPAAVVEPCGSLVGLIFYLVDVPHRRVAMRNVAAAFPSRPPRAHRAIVRGAFQHFGRLLFAMLKFSAYTPPEILARVQFDGEEHVRHAQAQGRGVLFITGHFGFWEVQAVAHALRLGRMAVLARTLDNRGLNGVLETIRTRTGNLVVYRQGALRRVLRLLQAGESVGILIDQHILGRDAVQVNFFDRPAATTTAVAALALRTNAPVIPLFALPLGGLRYRLVYEPPVEPPTSDTPDAIRDFTQRCTDVLEMYVRRHPELWLWMHRRWRD
jgi:KDO2-lipid IV(A) lauroyltransferase